MCIARRFDLLPELFVDGRGVRNVSHDWGVDPVVDAYRKER
jgi:hypothetical protein